MIVHVRWTDAVSAFTNPWTSLADIVDELADASIDTVGYLVEDHGAPFVVVAASVTRWGDKLAYGGIVAIPEAMVTSIEKWDDPPPDPVQIPLANFDLFAPAPPLPSD